MTLRVTMLGSGTSIGVPVIGCTCAVCTSADPRNKRFRPGVRLELDRSVVLIDTPTDLRQQALRYRVDRVDAVLYTHAHADHIFGLDDLRVFNFRQRQVIPCFGSADTLEALRQTFAYAFTDGQKGGGRPKIELVEVRDAFELFGQEVVPIPVFHGDLEVFGYRLGRFAYVTDCNFIPEQSFELLDGVELLILGALRFRSHPTHFTVQEAIEAADRIGARQTFLTHIAHEIDHSAPAFPLPPGVELGFDGLSFDLD